VQAVSTVTDKLGVETLRGLCAASTRRTAVKRAAKLARRPADRSISVQARNPREDARRRVCRATWTGGYRCIEIVPRPNPVQLSSCHTGYWYCRTVGNFGWKYFVPSIHYQTANCCLSSVLILSVWHRRQNGFESK